MQSVGLLAPALHVLQCHAAVHSVLLFAHFGGGGGGAGAAPSQFTISFSASPVGVRNVLPAYCIEVEEVGSGLSQAPVHHH